MFALSLLIFIIIDLEPYVFFFVLFGRHNFVICILGTLRAIIFGTMKSNTLPLNAGGGALVVVNVYVSEYGPQPASLLA